MSNENGLSCCVSGSYSKFWPEISETILEFKDLDIKVLEPKGNWILTPPTHVLEISKPNRFKPLSSEVNLTAVQVEDNFLSAVKVSDFLYLDDHQNYFGDMAAREVGYALGKGIPVFMRQKPSELLDIHPDMLEYVRIALPGEVRSLLDSGK